MITTEQLVRQNVIACFSGIVGTLANSAEFNGHTSDLHELSEEAMELCYPVTDYEEAAIQAGWVFHPDDNGLDEFWTRGGEPVLPGETQVAYSAEEACELDDLEPYEREIFEHWAVSEWLGERLLEHGERVGPFGNFTVWGRTCSGQGIACDYVVQQIAKAINA